MAIGTDATIHYFGTQDTVTAGGGTSAVVDGAYSASGDVVSGGWTNDDDAPRAMVVLQCQQATVGSGSISLYARRMNVQSTNDEPQPDSSFPGELIGAFTLDAGSATSTDMYLITEARLPNVYTSQVYEFYIKNNTGQSIAAGWVMYVTPVTDGPHA